MNDIMKTGIRALDRAIGGGFRKKTLNIYGAGTGCGKSFYLATIASKLAKNKRRGLVLSYDKKVENMDFTGCPKQVGYLWVSNVDISNWNSRYISNKIEDIERNTKTKLDFICVDNIGGMNCSTTYKPGIYQELVSIAHENKIALIGTIQTNRITSGSLATIGTSIHCATSVDTLISCLDTKRQFGNLYAHCKVMKSRYNQPDQEFSIAIGKV